MRKRLAALAGLSAALGAGIAWLLLRNEKDVSDLPIGIGDEERRVSTTLRQVLT
jgi:hypothetical protein